jgi:hypothetical protein
LAWHTSTPWLIGRCIRCRLSIVKSKSAAWFSLRPSQRHDSAAITAVFSRQNTFDIKADYQFSNGYRFFGRESYQRRDLHQARAAAQYTALAAQRGGAAAVHPYAHNRTHCASAQYLGQCDADVSLSKSEAIREGMTVSVQRDAFNVSNTPHYSDPDTNLADSNFGQIGGTNGTPRQLQIGAHFNF